MTDVRTDPDAFARRVLGIDLWPHQIEAAELPGFVNVLAKARRTGGTVLAEVMAIHTAFANAGCSCSRQRRTPPDASPNQRTKSRPKRPAGARQHGGSPPARRL